VGLQTFCIFSNIRGDIRVTFADSIETGHQYTGEKFILMVEKNSNLLLFWKILGDFISDQQNILI